MELTRAQPRGRALPAQLDLPHREAGEGRASASATGRRRRGADQPTPTSRARASTRGSPASCATTRSSSCPATSGGSCSSEALQGASPDRRRRLRPRRLHRSTASSATSAGAIYNALLAAYNGDYLQGAAARAGGALLPLAPLPGRGGDRRAAAVRGRGLPPGHRRPQPGQPAPGAAERRALRAARPAGRGQPRASSSTPTC